MRTRHPVVLIHGVFGYGSKRPLWNRWAPYWPERALDAMGANYLVVDVGVLSSDHDRACEAFYQLYGGRVDYGAAHSEQHGHKRFGYTHETALHAQWSEEHPVHLVGHSFGATTAIELYQLICQDYFGVGSNHKWVKSIVSIAGPLSGTTLTHLFGLHDGKMVARTLGHAIGASLCVWQTLHVQFPVLRKIFDYRMPQWEIIESYREALSASCRILASSDLAVYDILPARRLERNTRLVEMDKPFLFSIATSTHTKFPITEVALSILVMSFLAATVASAWYGEGEAAVACWVLLIGAVCTLLAKLRDLDYATLPCFSFLRFQMKWCVRLLHDIFDGFDRDDWEHNDGAVNVVSMLNPMQLRQISDESDEDDSSGSEAGSTTSTATTLSSSVMCPLMTTHRLDLYTYGSSSGEKKSIKLQPGRWYVHQELKNHMAGTHFDSGAPEFYRRLLHLMATEMEE